MRLGLLQFDVALGAPEDNFERMQALTRDLHVDLLVLPELCTSGYLLDEGQARELAIALPGPALAPFEALAKRLDAYIIGGVIEESDGALYNTALVVGPDGWIGKQRKVHITKLEQRFFSPGTSWETFQLGPVTAGVVTCFDAWFPEASRELCRRGVQLLCQPAAFGGRRHWT